MSTIKGGKPREVFIYNASDLEAAYSEIGSLGISYTAGVLASFPPLLNHIGLPTAICDAQDKRSSNFE